MRSNLRTFKLKRLVLASGNPTEDERQHNALYSSFYDTFLEGKVDIKAKTIFVNAKQVKGSRFSAKISPDHLYAINVFSEPLPNEAFFDNFEEQTKLKNEQADLKRQAASKEIKLEKLQEKLEALSEEKEIKKAEIEIKQVELEAVELKEQLAEKENRLKELQAAVFEPEEDLEAMEETEEADEEEKPEEADAENNEEDDDVIVEETEKEDEGTIDLTKEDESPTKASTTTTVTPQRFRVLLGLKEPLESVKGVFCDIPDAKEMIPKVHCLLLEMELKGKKYTELKEFFGYLEKCCGDVNKDLEAWGSKKCTSIATKLLKEAIEKRKMDFEVESCPNGCGQSFRVYELQAHRMNDCRKRLVECKFCKQEFVADTLQDHHDECPRFRLRCVNGCGKSIAREDMQKHQEEECSFQIVCCDYARYGCTAKLKKRGKTQHMKSQVQYHLSLVEKGFCVIAQKYDRLQTFLQEKHDDFPDMADRKSVV